MSAFRDLNISALGCDRRRDDFAPNAAGSADSAVEGYQRATKRFRQCYVPGIITREVMS